MSRPKTRKQVEELLKLRTMALNWDNCLESPLVTKRNRWDNETRLYIEELELILEDLQVQAFEALVAGCEEGGE